MSKLDPGVVAEAHAYAQSFQGPGDKPPAYDLGNFALLLKALSPSPEDLLFFHYAGRPFEAGGVLPPPRRRECPDLGRRWLGLTDVS